MKKANEGLSVRSLLSIFLIIVAVVLFQSVNTNVCFGLKNPFISPFKIKQYKNITKNPLSSVDLQAIASSSNSDKNVAIINDKPYYIGSKIMGNTIVNITSEAVIVKLKSGKVVKLLLAKYEGFKK